MQRPAAVGSRPPELKQVSFAPLTAREYIKLRIKDQLQTSSTSRGPTQDKT